jgi:chromosome segregation ATPase
VARVEKELAAARADMGFFSDKARLTAEEAAAQRKHFEEASAALSQAQSMLAQEREKFTRERSELESRVAASAQTATQVVEQSAAELAAARAAYDALKKSMAEAEERAKLVARQLAEAHSAQQRADGKIAELQAAAKRSAEQIEALKQQVASAREEAEASAHRASSRVEDHASSARMEIATLQTERDNLSQQRDELLRRLTRVTDEHKRLLNDLTAEPKIVPPPAAMEEVPSANVIEVSIPEVLPPDKGNGIAIPRIRPMAIPPPRISTL